MTESHIEQTSALPKLNSKPRYRVFISYSHEDQILVEKIAAILIRNGLQPMWDRNFTHGQGFDDQIKNFIAHAHVFLPVLTKTADARKWVHQEIGYSEALHIPVLPVAVEELPGEMIQRIHALRLEQGDPESLSPYLSKEAIDVLLEPAPCDSPALYACAALPEDRARMMAEYADRVFALGERDVVRQKGALSSFHIPTETVSHPIWARRYGRQGRSEQHCRLQRKERLALERHAAVAGCKLIVDPYIPYKKYGPDSRLCRLESLLRYLDSTDPDHCWIAIPRKMDERANLTILGNWFVAESLAGEEGRGYRQTIFTRHAPTIMERMDDFDREFDEALAASGVATPEGSLDHAVKTIREIVDSLETGA